MRFLLSFAGAVIIAIGLFALMVVLVMPPRDDSDPVEELGRVSFVRSVADTTSDSRQRQERQAPEEPQPPEPTPQPPQPQQPRMDAEIDLNIDIPSVSTDMSISMPTLTGLTAAPVQAAPEPAAPAPAPAMDEAPSLSEEVSPLVDIPPNYPQRALAAGIEGEVTLSFTITAEGRVEDLEVTHAQPKGVFEREARRAASRWRFAPRRENGQSVARQATKTLYFRLDEGR